MTNEHFFQNKECPYFPCHKLATGEPSTPLLEDFHCKYCFCPLYPLGTQCGGHFTYTKDGIKDCRLCLLPHTKDANEHIMSHIQEVIDLARKPF